MTNSANIAAVCAQVCGKGPATTPEKLEAALFEGLPDSQQQTVQGAFKACSYGNADFSKESGAKVLAVTVPIPCKGSTPWNLPYDSSTCPYVGELGLSGLHVLSPPVPSRLLSTVDYQMAAACIMFDLYLTRPNHAPATGRSETANCQSVPWLSQDLAVSFFDSPTPTQLASTAKRLVRVRPDPNPC